MRVGSQSTCRADVEQPERWRMRRTSGYISSVSLLYCASRIADAAISDAGNSSKEYSSSASSYFKRKHS